jgi:predicted signal transduction protein with EAL and GGDEF domain
LKTCIRAADTAARLGGNEFVVLLEDVPDRHQATDLADRIADALRAPVSLGGREVMVTASIGVALSTPQHDRAESVLCNADLALYRAKALGKARWALFEPNMEHQALERLELETDLRKALGTSELRLVYQPIMSLTDGQIVEVEALVRWQHPTRGPISPAKFIPIAEDSGVIEPLGLWVLQEACRQAAQWQPTMSTGKSLVMSVNLSSRQFQDPRLVEQVRGVLDEAGLPASALKLEITESVLMQDVEATAARMRALTDIGVRLAIDDFGTGYSSLSYLQRLPVETLKVDRSFVVGLGGSDPQAPAIVRGIVAMAKALRMSVTAEGIETAAQEAHLREMGCDRGQGYLFARPLPAADVDRMLDSTLGTSSDVAAA